VAKAALSVTEVLSGVDHVSVQFGGEVVVGILRNIVPFSFRFLGTHFQFVCEGTFGQAKRGVAVGDVRVDTEVWHKVVDVISSRRLFMFVLTASS